MRLGTFLIHSLTQGCVGRLNQLASDARPNLNAIVSRDGSWRTFFTFAKPALPAKFAAQLRGLYVLVANKYWVDEIYGALIVTPLLLVSRYLLKGLIDTGVIGGTTYGAGYTAQGFGAIVQRVQSGNIRSYAGWLALGAAVLLIVTYFGFTAHFH